MRADRDGISLPSGVKSRVIKFEGDSGTRLRQTGDAVLCS